MTNTRSTPPPAATESKRPPIGSARVDRPLSLPTRAMRGLLVPVRVILIPFGYFFRIREPLPIFFRVALPLAFIAIVVGAWYTVTKGESYLGRFAKHSPLDRRRIEIEKALGAPVKLETIDREQRSWATGEKKVRSEIAAVVAPLAAFEAKRAEVEAFLGKGEFTVEPVSGTADVRLAATSHFGVFDRDGEWAKARTRLEQIPGVVLETEDRIEAPGTEREKTVVIVRSLRVPTETADVRATLDGVFGKGAWLIEAGPDGRPVVRGPEIIETRRVGPALLPSPKEMLDSLPSLINRKWSTWQDAAAWWKVGEPEAAPGTGPDGGPAPEVRTFASIDWRSPTEAPFQLLDAIYTWAIGPNWTDWKLLFAVSWSTLRIVLGFVAAALVAVPLGILMGSFTKPRTFFDPLMLMGSYLPLPAFLALTLVWFGTGEAQKIGFLAICTFVVLLPQVVMAIEAVPKAHIDSAVTLGATRWQQMRHVLVKGAKADIMRALRLSFAVGWTWIIVAEYINAKSGLGFLIQLGERRLEYRPHVYAVIAVIIAVAFCVNSVWAWIERRMYPYREAH